MINLYNELYMMGTEKKQIAEKTCNKKERYPTKHCAFMILNHSDA